MATKKVAKSVEVLEQVSTNVAVADAPKLAGAALIHAQAAKADAAKNASQVELTRVIHELEPEPEIEYEVESTVVESSETETVMNTSSLNPAAVEATVAESMAELDQLVQQYTEAQNLANAIREKLKPIAVEYNNELKEVKFRKLASFSEGEKTSIYNAVLETCGLEVLANVYVGLLELDEYGVDDGEVSTPYPESFAQWCKTQGFMTEVSVQSDAIKLQKYEYLMRKCQQNQKALGGVQAVVMGLFKVGKGSSKGATVSSGDVSENYAETTVKIPGYESAEKGLKVTKKTIDDNFTPKGASTFNYLTKTLGLDKGTTDYKEAEEALETVLKELNRK